MINDGDLPSDADLEGLTSEDFTPHEDLPEYTPFNPDLDIKGFSLI